MLLFRILKLERFGSFAVSGVVERGKIKPRKEQVTHGIFKPKLTKM
ncbi:MAG: Unknown protein [uncultured Sulfurovum sp.]|uniref:Uncharacterized protein n=1 Tax=uncultured Sulfurovum sp. TaxID=269237 RepID=A0A6S6U729_9BACT|nr:MAG: Unknown protein [uncultured Sulfurovum sp.]